MYVSIFELKEIKVLKWAELISLIAKYMRASPEVLFSRSCGWNDLGRHVDGLCRSV